MFFITRITPGGPLEAALQQAAAMQVERGMKDAGGSLSEEKKLELAAYYGFDRDFFPAYLAWLGVIPKEKDKQVIKFEKDTQEMPVTLQELLPRDQWKPDNAYRLTQAKVTRDGKLLADNAAALTSWRTSADKDKDRVQIYRPQYDGLLQGSLGTPPATTRMSGT